MRLAIVGSRTFSDYNFLKRVIAHFVNVAKITEIVSGGAKGADSLGRRFAKEFEIQLTEFLPDWDKYGKKAGYIRNVDIVNNSDIIFAFWDGESKGTNHTINIAKEKNKPLLVCNYVTKSFQKFNDGEIK